MYPRNDVMGYTVVVTDGEQRAALATVRSLGRAGHRVYVCAQRAGSLAATSRYCRGEMVVPDPLTEPEPFVRAVTEFVARTGADVLLPVSEAALLVILPERQRFTAAIPFTSLRQFEDICDKDRVLKAARSVGICVPAQHVIRDRGEAPASAPAFPVVLKPSRSVVGMSGKRSKVSVQYAADHAELDSALERLPDAAFPILLQQRIEGPGIAHSILLWQGETKAAFAHRRIREKPPSGGVSVLRESIPLDPELLERSIALLEQFDWQGVAMVEYKVDSKTGDPYLMEINGRLWGSLQLAIDAGVAFPGLLVACALGQDPAPAMDYRVGVRTWWEWGDVDHLLARLRHSRTKLALTDDAPSRTEVVASFLRTFRSGAAREIYSSDDPRPFFRESLDWLLRR
jgi:predicted ATP-grasp superfamily ATP-dependent carboligase